MCSAGESYDPRYLAGIVLFNRGDFFEAHEVWEAVWLDCPSDDRRFYQGLIQAAVSLCHFCNGNLRGALKLFRSARDYMSRYPSPYHGLDIEAFWQAMEKCYEELLSRGVDSDVQIQEERIPEISLSPLPTEWPDPADFLTDD